MLMLGVFLYTQTDTPSYPTLFALYSLSVAFYMPTLALSNSVAYTSLDQAGLDLVKSFPPIRVFGTVGFICTMIAVSLLGLGGYEWAVRCLGYHQPRPRSLRADATQLPHGSQGAEQEPRRSPRPTCLRALQAA